MFARHVLRRLVPIRWRRRPFRWGSFRRLEPVSRVFGFDRGLSIDRYYIEGFLERHSADIHGHVLELANADYTKRFGGDRVTHSDVLHAKEGNLHATLVGDLASGAGIPIELYDCLILTQTLPFIYDLHGAVAHCFRALKPGGVLLATFPGICQISRYDMKQWGDYWRLTDLSARLLFEEVFPPGNVTVETHGNVLAAVAELHGLAADELTPRELHFEDADYQVSIAVRAVRSHRLETGPPFEGREEKPPLD